jgi:hypothetical protein
MNIINESILNRQLYKTFLPCSLTPMYHHPVPYCCMTCAGIIIVCDNSNIVSFNKLVSFFNSGNSCGTISVRTQTYTIIHKCQ